MVKKQQMRWSEAGAHNLLQVRTEEDPGDHGRNANRTGDGN